jgi:hypothetical protein
MGVYSDLPRAISKGCEKMKAAWICGIVIVGLTGCADTVLQDPAIDEPHPSGVQITVDKWWGPSLLDSAIEQVARKNGFACAREPYNGTNIPIPIAKLPKLLVCGFRDGFKRIAPILVVHPSSDPRAVFIEIPWGYSFCEGGGGSTRCECDSTEALKALEALKTFPASNSHCKCKGEMHSELQLEAIARKVIADLRSSLRGRISRFQVQDSNDQNGKGECSDLVF